jgi:hypothetical protein
MLDAVFDDRASEKPRGTGFPASEVIRMQQAAGNAQTRQSKKGSKHKLLRAQTLMMGQRVEGNLEVTWGWIEEPIACGAIHSAAGLCLAFGPGLRQKLAATASGTRGLPVQLTHGLWPVECIRL